MNHEGLVGKRILAVDDEEDVLAVIKEQLEECEVTATVDYETARKHLEEGAFDLVMLDIMGVRGFDLLDLARRKRIPAVILTAHSLTPQSLQKAIDKGAYSFLPKEELSRLSELIEEILEDVERGETHWPRLIGRLSPRFRELWGQTWTEVRFPPDSKANW
ncbi:MAG: response regulator [Thermodesulfobacteriota bacterium]